MPPSKRDHDMGRYGDLEIDAEGGSEKTADARLQHLEAIDAVTRAMGTTLEPRESLRRGLKALREALDVDRATLLRLNDPAPHSLRVFLQDTSEEWATSMEGEVIPFGDAALTVYQRHFEHETSRPILLDMTEMVGSARLRSLDVRAVVGVGLRPLDGQPWMLDVHVCREGHEPDDADARVLLDAGARFSIAIDSMQKERRLRERERRFHAIAEHAPIGVFMLSEGRFRYVNQPFADVVGVDAEGILSDMRPATLFQTAPCMHLCTHCRDGSAGMGGVHRARIEHPTRGSRRVEISCAPVEEQGVPGVVGTVTDITEREAMREQMASVAKMAALASLVGGVAHHFNNLLAGVLGNVYVLEDSPGREAWELESLADMRLSGERAAALVRQLMTFARKGRTSLVERDLVALMESTVATLELALPASTTIRAEWPSVTLYALVDPGGVQEILLNLVDNARQAQSERPTQRVTIRLAVLPATEDETQRAPKGCAELRVEDEGVGIRPEDLPHVFEPFFTTRDVGLGTGMGLATVYGCVGQMGGDVRIESELDEGTRVILRIPLAEASGPHTPANASILPGAGETVLVVDDDETVRSVLRRVLEHLGYGVRVYATATRALEAFDAEPEGFAALLSDMVMPDMGGCELATELRRRQPELPVMLMTGYDPDRLAGVAQIPGEAPRVLEKPIRLNQLSRALAKLLQRE